ncbi:LysR substrate-binding domain-containing protein [Cereibacter azotoformans]|uniref:LysR family transcriptional regulator n=1 Tax=Cereibacter azotoformans TaxID=43057 RepID=UPI000C6EB52A|nr:LysR substrate-binding domain-containing protein [Cereibacter azotoformans]ULB11894.1 LysR substrate-binding domain-containing protein [Cereibacter azotoformans]
MLDLGQLRSFLAVHDTASFSLAATRLGLAQSTVSQHVRRLEDHLGRRLFDRDTHRVAPTAAGEMLLAEARALLEISDRLEAQFLQSRLRGRLRFGLSEDMVNGPLPSILRGFSAANPSVDLELTVALSAALFAEQEMGRIDLVLAKRRLGDDRGHVVAREPLVWLARDPDLVARRRPLPLISFPAPSITRAAALDALEQAQLPWLISCTCSSLSGLTAAARAGMGVFVQPRGLTPEGLREVPADMLPPLETVEFVLVERRGADRALMAALTREILRQTGRQPPAPAAR